MSLYPWPADSLTKLIAAPVVTITHTVTLEWVRTLATNDVVRLTVPAESIDVDEDASRRPFGIASILFAARPFDTIPPDAFTDLITRVYVTATYTGDPPAAEERYVFAGVVIEVEDAGAGQRITAHTPDVFDDYPHTGATWEIPDDVTSGGDALQEFRDYDPTVYSYANHPDTPPIAGSGTLDLIRSLALNPGDNIADFAAAVVACYPNATMIPSRNAAKIYLSERATVVPATALDLRAGAGLTLDDPTITWGPDDWANVLRFTARWLDTTTGQEVTQTVTRTNLPTRDYRNLRMMRVADITRSWRPPGDDVSTHTALLDGLLERLEARTWRATLSAKPALWIRPGDPARVTDTLAGVITSRRFTFPANLMSVTVRPV